MQRSQQHNDSSTADPAPAAQPAVAANDADRPRRARTAFLRFSHDHRPQVKKEQPDLRFGEVAMEVARRWKAADHETREVSQLSPAQLAPPYLAPAPLLSAALCTTAARPGGLQCMLAASLTV